MPGSGAVTRSPSMSILPREGAIRPSMQRKQRGLAAARGADDGDDLAVADFEIDVAEDFKRAVVLAETLDADARLGARLCD